MKIIHIVLVGPFTESMTYQENILPIQNALDGHEVFIIASQYYWDKSKIKKTSECDKIIENGIRLIRIEYDNIINNYISEKIRKASKLIKLINEIEPDIIFLHDPQTYEILTVSKYKSAHRWVKFYIDNHADKNNSATNIFSYYILHKIFYKNILKKAEINIDKCFYITNSSKKFLKDVYSFKRKLEYLPLGGVRYNISKREKYKIKKELGIKEKDIIMIHTGKFNRIKKTIELLRIFNKKAYENMQLILIGSIEKTYEEEMNLLINNNKKIKYLGWKNGYELLKYLAVSDVYLQPGSASVTLQQSIASGNAVIVADEEIYSDIVQGNGWIIRDIKEIEKILDIISQDPEILHKMKMKSIEIAEKLLYYDILAKHMY